MPLSEEEQKILQEIEAQLSESDPGLVEQVSRTTLYRHAARSIRWSALGFVVGLAFLLATYTRGVLLAIAGFAIMLACLFIIERNVRKMGRAGMQNLTGGLRPGGGVGGAISERGRALRERFRRDDES